MALDLDAIEVAARHETDGIAATSGREAIPHERVPYIVTYYKTIPDHIALKPATLIERSDVLALVAVARVARRLLTLKRRVNMLYDRSDRYDDALIAYGEQLETLAVLLAPPAAPRAAGRETRMAQATRERYLLWYAGLVREVKAMLPVPAAIAWLNAHREMARRSMAAVQREWNAEKSRLRAAGEGGDDG